MWAIFTAPRILGFDLGRTGLIGRGPDSPAIGSILRVCGGLDIPGLGPDSLDLGVRILRAGVRILRVFGYFWVDKSNWGRSLVVVLGRGLIVIIKSYLH